jgi:hypothetical protein
MTAFCEVWLSCKEQSGPLPITNIIRRVQDTERALEEVYLMNGGKGVYVGGTLISILI